MSDSQSYFPQTRHSVIEGLGNAASPAWNTFFAIYGPIIHRFARHAGLTEHDADEVLSAVMRSFLVRVRGGEFRVDHEKGRFRYYLRTMTNRAIHEYRRKNARRPLALEDLGPVEDPAVAKDDERWNQFERQERLRACLDRLRTSGRVGTRDMEAFELYALRRQSPEEVAQRLGISKSRVYVIKHEVMRHLRDVRRELDSILGEV
ncbi:MAG: hypothetical protein AMXMBFR13_05080 [Phycisphaerae bacterium]|jgi:RNA polymerase sigma factor (sigma-70 family)